MKFIVHFSSQGRFLSRNLHRSIKENISRAMDAFAINGVDPNRYASGCQQISRLPKCNVLRFLLGLCLGVEANLC